MALLNLAHAMTDTADLLSITLLLSAIFWVIVFMPRGRRTRQHDVLIAADPKTVWDTYLFHAGRRDYRPGMRILGCEILAENPLTVRYTLQPDYMASPSSLIFTYEVYEPYRRYRLLCDENKIVEEGELEETPLGTQLRVAITGPVRGWLFPSALRRRHKQNFRALKDLCEGRAPEAPRSALPAAHWWERWSMGIILGLVAIFACRALGAPLWPAIVLLVSLGMFSFLRSARFVCRLLVIG